MNRLRGLILVFCAALSVPLAYFILRTYKSLEQEETARLRYFADTLFYEMEQGLAELVRTEESRPVDVYNYYYHPEPDDNDPETAVRSPLSKKPESEFIVGYFQNNRDGSFQTPMVEKGEPPSEAVAGLVAELRNINREFNGKRSTMPVGYTAPVVDPVKAEVKAKQETAFADRYLKLDRRRKTKDSLGYDKKRVEKITPSQAQNIAQLDEQAAERRPAQAMESEQNARHPSDADKRLESKPPPEGLIEEQTAAARSSEIRAESPPVVNPVVRDRLEVEVDPLQSVLINDRRIFMFRRILFRNDVYRQGLVLDARAFLSFLDDSYFSGQPMARYAVLHLAIMDGDRPVASQKSGSNGPGSIFTMERPFPRPFSFLRATLVCHRIPDSEGRRTLTIMISVLAGIVLIGLFAIYRSARVVMDLSERRSKFVSSVTHELKTPLTNIRMYIEMLEQGIASTPEREQHYFQVLNSESARLSRLINNVLEFSRIEKKQYNFDIREGDFDDVIREAAHVMKEKLRREGFRLIVNREGDFRFFYDREVMIQLLINLIENSLKFGSSARLKEIRIALRRENKWIVISVSDFGPGIPKHALKRVFDDFYRVNSEGVQSTRGAGIGLAFVKKLVVAMGGKVKAENNSGPGCTISIMMKENKNGG